MVQAAGRSPTVGDWLGHWLDHLAARKVRPGTLESYRSTVRLHLGPGIGHHRIDRCSLSTSSGSTPRWQTRV
jgi:hypothetical protein